MRTNIVLAAVATVFSGCSSLPWNLEATHIAAIEADRSTSAIIFEVDELDTVCGNDGALMTLERVSDKAVVELRAFRGMLDNTAPVRAQPVEPGDWKPVEIVCDNYGAVGSTVLHRKTFVSTRLVSETITVKTGEIVYPGTFMLRPALNTGSGEIGLIALLDDRTDVERKKLADRYPHLADAFCEPSSTQRSSIERACLHFSLPTPPDSARRCRGRRARRAAGRGDAPRGSHSSPGR